MFFFNNLTDIQRKLFVDLRQVYEAYRLSQSQAEHYAGSMRWREKNGTDYLFRKVGSAEKGLGVRSPQTEKIHVSFLEGRKKIKERLAGQTKALDVQAALAKASGVGRVPRIVAQILRKLDDAQILGHIRIVGTNALFAYEALAAVTVAGDALATGDIDLLIDARRRLRIMIPDKTERSVAGLAKRIDPSFEILPGNPYRMANSNGFMLDLIRPQPNPAWKAEAGAQLADGDLVPSPIEGLQWLVNAPRIDALVVDVNGYPAPITAPDPRIWMVHKMWLSARPLRDPVKVQRDVAQAHLMRELLMEKLPQFPLDDVFFNSLPHPLRAVSSSLRPPPPPLNDEDDDVFPTPKW